MRILLVHSFYGSSSASGENRVVLEEWDLLRSAGHDVVEYFSYSDTVRDRGPLPVICTALLVPWNSSALEKVRTLIRSLDPDVMHVHNVFPLLSPSVFRAASGTRTAVVNTLHNYRTVCPAAIPLRGGVSCTRCIETRSVKPALRYGCYRNSHIATVPLAAGVALHRSIGTYTQHVDAFIALTQFQKTVLVQGGIPESRISIKPNCYSGTPRRIPWHEREDKAVFIGRISPEKGVDTLLAAWRKWGVDAPRLDIIGGGPDLQRLRPSERNDAGRVAFLGPKPVEEARALLASAKLLIVPSTWFEGFPMVLCEAFALGVPVAASRFPTFEELVEARGLGRLFDPGNAEDLCSTVSALWGQQTGLKRMSCLAEEESDARYSPRQNLAQLQAIYEGAMENRRARMQQSRRNTFPLRRFSGERTRGTVG